MYIVYPCKKDTYITNRMYLNTDGKYANFGRSSTIDLYKIYNENSKIKQQAIFKILSKPTDGLEINFKNFSNITYILRFDHSILPENSGLIDGKIVIGLNGLDSIEEITNKIKDVINTPYKGIICEIHSDTGLISLTQDKSDFIEIVNLNIPISNTIKLIQDFSRVEYSIGLIKFDLEKINEYFNYEKVKDYISIKLHMKDVTSGISKPKDYSLEVLPLTKEFNEGLGRDVYNLQDIDTANFILANYNGQTNQKYYWETSGSIGLIEKSGSIQNTDVVTHWNGTDFKLCNQSFIASEDLEIDITNIYKSFWKQNDSLIDYGLAVQFSSQSLYDDETYFAKRFASSNVRNRILKPSLNIMIDDSSYYVSSDINFYFDQSNNSLLYNKTGGKLTNIKKLNNGQIVDVEDGDLSLVITSIDLISGSNNPVFEDQFSVSQLTDIKNIQNIGVYKSSWAINSLDNEEILNLLLTKEYLEFNFEWQKENTTIFSETKKVYRNTYQTTNTFKRLRSNVKLFAHDLSLLNSIYKMSVIFYDLDAQHDFVKTPYGLEGLDVGDVFYELIDYDSREILIPLTKLQNATKCIKEKDYYWFPFFNSELFYGRRIQFVFKLDQQEQNNLTVSSNEIFRVGHNG
jgi:hypothetical protein